MCTILLSQCPILQNSEANCPKNWQFTIEFWGAAALKPQTELG